MITQEELWSIIRKNRIWDDTGATFIIIDENLKVLFVNNSPVDENTKMCPGDLLKCANAIEETKGCGFHKKLCHMPASQHAEEIASHQNEVDCQQRYVGRQ